MIELIDVQKSYGDVTPLKSVSTVINDGDVISVIGPSGTGKSTLLRAISMLDPPDSGRILIDGEEITAKGAEVDRIRRKMGMVFQSFNLFPHLSVIENLMAAPMHVLGKSRDEAYSLGMEKLRDVGLEHFATKYPDMLSGGQKQRVAIARTLAMDPEIILFDEPTSALDPTMVGEVESIIRGIADGGRTLMIVTHEMRFAREVSNRVFYMDEGGIYEDGAPEEIFANPKREKTRNFIKKLRTLSYDIVPGEFDPAAAVLEIPAFCCKNLMSPSSAVGTAAVFEELCLQLLAGRRQRAEIIFSADDRSVAVISEYSGEAIPAGELENGISGRLLSHYAGGIKNEASLSGDFPNRITVNVKCVTGDGSL